MCTGALEEHSMSATNPGSANPLSNLDQWEDFLEGRYKEGKSESDFCQYGAKANPGVAEFYRTNHERQTVDYVLGKEKQYFGLLPLPSKVSVHVNPFCSPPLVAPCGRV